MRAVRRSEKKLLVVALVMEALVPTRLVMMVVPVRLTSLRVLMEVVESTPFTVDSRVLEAPPV